jgi:hypothetical protein
MPLLGLNDFGVTYTDYTLPDTTSADVYNGFSVRVGYIHQTAPVLVSCTGADTLIGSGVGSGVTSFYLTRPGEVVTFEADVGRGEWVVIPGGISDYKEFWIATPQTPMGSTIIWTYQPLPGQPATPVLVSHLAGVFTPTVDSITYDLELSCEIAFIIAANNADVSCDVTGTLTGTGIDYIPTLKEAFAHTRAATFDRTFQMSGSVFPLAGDTFSYSTGYVGTAGSTTNLTAAVLTIEA